MSYGFKVGGRFEIYVNKSNANEIRIGWLTEDQNDFLRRINGIQDSICNRSYISGINTTFTWNSTTLQETRSFSQQINESGIYYLYYLSCITNQYYFDINVFATNPDSLLDSRWDVYFQIVHYFVIALFLVVVFWIGNWFMHFSAQIGLHYFFTSSFIFIFLKRLFKYYYLQQQKTNDSVTVLTILFIIFSICADVSLYTALLLAAKGWCIIRDSIKLCDIFLCLIYSAVFITITYVTEYFHISSDLQLFLMLIQFVSLALYIKELIMSIEDASFHILAHLLSISNSGVDPESTPIYRKHMMYQHFQWTVITYCCLILISLMVSMFVEPGFSTSEIMSIIIDIVLLVLIIIIFRIREKDANGYMMFGEGNQEFTLTDLEGISVDGNEIRRGDTKWNEGMDLPGSPSVVASPSVATIESPDGTEVVTIKQGSYSSNGSV